MAKPAARKSKEFLTSEEIMETLREAPDDRVRDGLLSYNRILSRLDRNSYFSPEQIIELLSLLGADNVNKPTYLNDLLTKMNSESRFSPDQAASLLASFRPEDRKHIYLKDIFFKMGTPSNLSCEQVIEHVRSFTVADRVRAMTAILPKMNPESLFTFEQVTEAFNLFSDNGRLNTWDDIMDGVFSRAPYFSYEQVKTLGESLKNFPAFRVGPALLTKIDPASRFSLEQIAEFAQITKADIKVLGIMFSKIDPASRFSAEQIIEFAGRIKLSEDAGIGDLQFSQDSVTQHFQLSKSPASQYYLQLALTKMDPASRFSANQVVELFKYPLAEALEVLLQKMDPASHFSPDHIIEIFRSAKRHLPHRAFQEILSKMDPASHFNPGQIVEVMDNIDVQWQHLVAETILEKMDPASHFSSDQIVEVMDNIDVQWQYLVAETILEKMDPASHFSSDQIVKLSKIHPEGYKKAHEFAKNLVSKMDPQSHFSPEQVGEFMSNLGFYQHPKIHRELFLKARDGNFNFLVNSLLPKVYPQASFSPQQIVDLEKYISESFKDRDDFFNKMASPSGFGGIDPDQFIQLTRGISNPLLYKILFSHLGRESCFAPEQIYQHLRDVGPLGFEIHKKLNLSHNFDVRGCIEYIRECSEICPDGIGFATSAALRSMNPSSKFNVNQIIEFVKTIPDINGKVNFLCELIGSQLLTIDVMLELRQPFNIDLLELGGIDSERSSQNIFLFNFSEFLNTMIEERRENELRAYDSFDAGNDADMIAPRQSPPSTTPSSTQSEQTFSATRQGRG